jgi:hypothetical protein
LESQLRYHLWVGLLVWGVLYCLDYYFTIVYARLYREGVNEKIVYEGSLELTPYYQKDIDSLRLRSPRFFRVLFLNLGLLSAAWWLAMSSQLPELYSILLGMYLLPQLAIHKRHVNNIFFFRAAKTNAIQGRIEFARPFMLRQSSLELLCYAVLLGVLSVVTNSWFVLGGALACLSLAVQHWRLARRSAPKASAVAAEQ